MPRTTFLYRPDTRYCFLKKTAGHRDFLLLYRRLNIWRRLTPARQAMSAARQEIVAKRGWERQARAGQGVAALRCVEPGIGQGMLSALRAPRPPQPGSLLAGLINDQAARPGPVLLVLDDYHAIDAQAIHDIVTFLLDH
jgi:hypothetical protein